MHNIYWVLIANATEARIYASKNPLKELELVENLDHPESRKLDHNLVSDSPGHYKAPNSERGTMQPRSNPVENEHEIFARQIGNILQKGLVTHKFSKLIIAAEPSFYGLLAHHFDKQLIKCINKVIQKEHYYINDKQLIEFLVKNH